MRAVAWPFGIVTIFAVAMIFAANWIRNQESSFRMSEIERTLSAASGHATQTFALADTILLNALGALRGRSPDDIDLSELNEIERASVGNLSQSMRLFIFRRDGTTRLLRSDLNVSDRDYFAYQVDPGRNAPERASMVDATGNMLVSAPVLGRASNVWVINVSRPIVDTNGASVGVVSVTIPLSIFNELFQALQAEPVDLFVMWRNDATVLVRAPDTLNIRGRRVPNAPLWSYYPAKQSGSYEAPGVTDNVRRIVIYRGLAPLPLVLAYGIDVQEISLEAMKRYWPLFAVAVATLLVALLFALRTLQATRALQKSNRDLQVAEATTRAAYEQTLSAKLEAERARFEAERANHAKSALLANFSHELRTPLNAVLGFTDMVRLGYKGPVTEAAKESLDLVHQAGDHLHRLIGTLLDISRLELDPNVIEIAPHDIRLTINDAIALTTASAAQKSVDFEVSFADGPTTIEFDRLRIIQVMLNLLSNAVRHSPTRATIAVALEFDSRDLHIYVRDLGPGVSVDRLATIAEPFGNPDKGKARPDGTGLGLAISREILRTHGGKLLFANRSGGGFEVCAVLPIRQWLAQRVLGPANGEVEV